MNHYANILEIRNAMKALFLKENFNKNVPYFETINKENCLVFSFSYLYNLSEQEQELVIDKEIKRLIFELEKLNIGISFVNKEFMQGSFTYYFNYFENKIVNNNLKNVLDFDLLYSEVKQRYSNFSEEKQMDIALSIYNNKKDTI